MKKITYITFLLLFFAYLAICGFLYWAQDSLLYHPKPRAFSTPLSMFTFKNDHEKIVVSTKQYSGKKAIIYFGGNGEDVSQNLPVFEKEFPKHALYFMHYRSYGGSTGSPSEKANISDAIALFKQVKENHADIAIVGRSLGTGIAIRLASQFTATHLVLITPYDSIEAIASSKFPYLPISFLLRDKYNSGKHASKIKIPTTVFMAGNDKVIPRESTETLFSRFQEGVASLVLIKDVGHNTISSHTQYLPALKNALIAASNTDKR